MEYEDKIAKAAEKHGAGEAFRTGLTQLNNDRGIKLNELDKDYPELLQELEKNNQDKPLFNRILHAYMDATSDPILDDEFTGFDFEEFESRIAALEKTPIFVEFGPEAITAIQGYLHEPDHPLVKELRADRELLREYWEIPDKYMASRVTPYHQQRIQDYYDRGKVSVPGQWADIQPHITAIDAAQAAYEWANRDVSDKLGKWEYATPVHMDLRFKHAGTRGEPGGALQPAAQPGGGSTFMQQLLGRTTTQPTTPTPAPAPAPSTGSANTFMEQLLAGAR